LIIPSCVSVIWLIVLEIDDGKEEDLGVSGGVRGVWILAQVELTRAGEDTEPLIDGEKTGAVGSMKIMGLGFPG